jgi:hypothetical protein
MKPEKPVVVCVRITQVLPESQPIYQLSRSSIEPITGPKELKLLSGGKYDACYDSVGSGRGRSAALSLWMLQRSVQQPEVYSGSRPDAASGRATGNCATGDRHLRERLRRRMRSELLRWQWPLPALRGMRVLLVHAVPRSEEPGLSAARGGPRGIVGNRTIPLLHLQGPGLLLQSELDRTRPLLRSHPHRIATGAGVCVSVGGFFQNPLCRHSSQNQNQCPRLRIA